MKVAKLTFLYVTGIILLVSLFVWVGYSALGSPHSGKENLELEEMTNEDKIHVEQRNQFEQTSTSEHYRIREYEGNLAIYILSNQNESQELLKITDISIESIDQSVSKTYLESLNFDSIEALENYLEGIVS